MPNQWTDRIVGDRMTVDQQFSDRVDGSQFSRQQWSLVMTAVEFDIEQPGEEDRAKLVADTSNLPSVIPELDAVDQQPPMGGGAPGQRGRDSGAGVLDGIKNALGIGGDSNDPGDNDPTADSVDQDRLRAAERLVQEYATELQTHLEDRQKWGEVRSAAKDD